MQGDEDEGAAKLLAETQPVPRGHLLMHLHAMLLKSS